MKSGGLDMSHASTTKALGSHRSHAMPTTTIPRPERGCTMRKRVMNDRMQIEPRLASVYRIMTLYHCTCEKQQWQCIPIGVGNQ